MRIVLLLEDLFVLGGVQKHVKWLASQLNALGFECLIVSGRNGVLEGEINAAIRTLLPASFASIQALAQDEAPGTKHGFRDQLVQILREHSSKLVSIISELGPSDIVVSTQVGMLAKLDSHGLLEDRKFRLIAAYHGSFRYAQAAKYWGDILRLYPKADACVFLTDADVLRFGECGITKARAIPNAAEPAKEVLEFEQRSGAAYVGRLHGEKNVSSLVDIWTDQRVGRRGHYLDLFGVGPEQSSIAARLGSDPNVAGVNLAGYTTSSRAELSTRKISVTASLNEGFPMAVLESLAVGTPVVAYDFGPCAAELLSNGGGIVVNPGDDREFASAALRLLDDKQTWEQASFHARQTAAYYSPNLVLRKWMSLFDVVRSTPIR